MRYVTQAIRLLAILGLVAAIGWGGKRISSMSKPAAEAATIHADLMDYFLRLAPPIARTRTSYLTRLFCRSMSVGFSACLVTRMPRC